MINYILNARSRIFWIALHILLGAVSILTPWILIGWFYLVLLTDGMSIIRKQRSSFVPIVYLIVYTTSFELLARMSETSPFIPYELGKYLLLLLLIAIKFRINRCAVRQKLKINDPLESPPNGVNIGL